MHGATEHPARGKYFSYGPFFFGCFVPSLLIFTLFAVMWGLDGYHYWRSAPGARVTDFATYQAHMLPPVEALQAHGTDDPLYATFGPITEPFNFASGPPMYIFDESGRLIDWTTDCGAGFLNNYAGIRWERLPLEELERALRQPGD